MKTIAFNPDLASWSNFELCERFDYLVNASPPAPGLGNRELQDAEISAINSELMLREDV